MNLPGIHDSSTEISRPANGSHPVSLRCVLVRNINDLIAHLDDWESLAANASEPNVFYEPWMLLPALEHYGHASNLQFLLIFGNDANNPLAGPLLCGFFPLERRLGFKGLPISVVSVW